MDSSSWSKTESLNAIKEKIRSGELTIEIMTRRLEDAVETEQNKPPEEMDAEYMMSCLRLLYSLQNSGPYERVYPHREKEFEEYVKRHYQRKSVRRRIVRVIGVAAAIVVLIMVGDSLLYREWLSGTSSKDGENYKIEGHVFDPGLVEGTYASLVTKEPLTTSSYDEVVEWFGSTPPELPWVSEGWTVEKYIVFPFSAHIDFRTLYRNESDDVLTFRVVFFEKPEGATVEFEQVAKGQVRQIAGHEVYVSENINNDIAVWRDDLATYSLDAPHGEEDLEKIIATMIEKGIKP